MLSSSNHAKINQIFKTLGKNDEFEVMFNNYRFDNKLSINDFMKVLKYVRWRSDEQNLKLYSKTSLDVVYMQERLNVYRVSINGIDNINNFLNLVHERKNHVVFTILLTQFLNNEHIELIRKEKNPKNIIDIDEYDIRFRKSKELEVDNKTINQLSNLPLSQAEKIVYRYKQRITLELINNEKEVVNLDLTTTQMSKTVNNISTSKKVYEVEIDYTTKTKSNSKTLTNIIDEISNVKKVLSDSEELLSKKEKHEIVTAYKNLVYGANNQSFKNLYTMRVISAEVQHIIDRIPNKYSVTDKADGSRTHFYIYKDTIYLISNNLDVRKLSKLKTTELNNTIIDGELIHLTSQQKYLFMIFDCLFYKNKDIRPEIELTKRVDKIYKICDKLNFSTYSIKEYKGEFNLSKIKKSYQIEIEHFYKHLNKVINDAKKNEIIFHPKLFMFPSGGNDSEVFLFSYLIWKNCTSNEVVNCPYLLDGIIYTGLEQKYTGERREQKYPIYKYKPPSLNSLDVYITFQRNKETGGYLEFFDNSLPDKVEDQIFRVVNFYVGDLYGNKEVPIPFMPENDNHEAFFPLKRGEVRDIEGNIVLDNTVVEIIYNNDPIIPHQYRWSILRTRWDKTDTVRRREKQYGNFSTVAIKIWKSMREAVSIEEIINLSSPDKYHTQKKILESRIDSTIITTDRQQDVYYQKITNLCKKMRNFHNWVKSILIYTYCSEASENKDGKSNRKRVVDIGCGRGGDNMKFYHARVKDYVGLDPDYEGIYSSTDGAISRYNVLKNKFPDFGNVSFVQADYSVPLKSIEQSKVLMNISAENKKKIDKLFGSSNKFDIVNSSFAIHYLFKDSNSLKNMLQNTDNLLKKNGFVLFTLFDGGQVMKLLGKSDKFTSYFTDDSGKRNILFSIKKKFKGDLKNEPGQSIDVHMSWVMQENEYYEEYLVSKEYMIESMKKIGCRLVDTELFENIYNLNEPYFKNVINYEENVKNKKFYENVAQFYGDLKGADKESKIYSFLNRYYIFQKI